MRRSESVFTKVTRDTKVRGKERMTQKNAFTLIEVMVAAILISVVGLSLLQMHQNSAEMSYKMQGKFKHSDWVLMAAFE